MKIVLTILAVLAVFGAVHVTELYLTAWPHTMGNQFSVALWLVLAVDFLADLVKHRA